MSVIDHVEVDDRGARRVSAGQRRAPPAAGRERRGPARAASSSCSRPSAYAELEAKEQLLLTITVNGFGKRTSAYEYRVTNRGGQGIINIETSARNGRVAATFPVGETDQVMLVTDQGQTIRIPVHDIRDRRPEHAGRQAVPHRCRTSTSSRRPASAESRQRGEDDEDGAEE